MPDGTPDKTPKSRRAGEATAERAGPHVAPREQTNLPEHLPYQLVHVSALLSLGVTRLFQAQFDLGIREWRVLALLGYYGPLSPSGLVGRAAFDKATVSRAIKRLEQDGLVVREPSPEPGARQIIHLTEAGAALHDRVAPISRLRRRIVESALTEKERVALKVMLQKLEKQLLWLNAEEEKDIAAMCGPADPDADPE